MAFHGTRQHVWCTWNYPGWVQRTLFFKLKTDCGQMSWNFLPKMQRSANEWLECVTYPKLGKCGKCWQFCFTQDVHFTSSWVKSIRSRQLSLNDITYYWPIRNNNQCIENATTKHLWRLWNISITCGLICRCWTSRRKRSKKFMMGSKELGCKGFDLGHEKLSTFNRAVTGLL